MIHTLYRRATKTFHTPSWVTSYLLLVFLSSSSLQFVFSEQLGFEHQLRSQLLWSKLVSRSIKRPRIKNDELRASSNQDQPINHASTKQETTRIQGPSDNRASQSGTDPTLSLCFCHVGNPETTNGSKWVPDRPSNQKVPEDTNLLCSKYQKCTKLQTASENEV